MLLDAGGKRVGGENDAYAQTSTGTRAEVTGVQDVVGNVGVSPGQDSSRIAGFELPSDGATVRERESGTSMATEMRFMETGREPRKRARIYHLLCPFVSCEYPV